MKRNLLVIGFMLAFTAINVSGQFFGVYTEDAIITEGLVLSIDNSDPLRTGYFTTDDVILEELVDAEAYEGSSAFKCSHNPEKNLLLMSIRPNEAVDLSAFENGYLNFAMKTADMYEFRIRLQTANGFVTFTSDYETDYGFVRDGEWHMVSVPIQDFLAADPSINLTNINTLFTLRSWSGGAPVGWEIAFDHMHFSVDAPTSIKDTDKIAAPSIFSNAEGSSITIAGVNRIDAVEIYNISGNLVKELTSPGNIINIADLSAGVYILKINANNTASSYKFIKK